MNQVLIISTAKKSATYTNGKFTFFGDKVSEQVTKIVLEANTFKIISVSLNQFEDLTSNEYLFYREDYLIGIQTVVNEISVIGYTIYSKGLKSFIHKSYINNCNFMEEIWESFWESEWLRDYWLSSNKENNGSSWWDITDTPVNSLVVFESLYEYPSEYLVNHLNKDRLDSGKWEKIDE